MERSAAPVRKCNGQVRPKVSKLWTCVCLGIHRSRFPSKQERTRTHKHLQMRAEAAVASSSDLGWSLAYVCISLPSHMRTRG